MSLYNRQLVFRMARGVTHYYYTRVASLISEEQLISEQVSGDLGILNRYKPLALNSITISQQQQKNLVLKEWDITN